MLLQIPLQSGVSLSDGLAGAATTYTEGTYYRGDLTQYGGNIYRHKIGVTTNVSPLQVGIRIYASSEAVTWVIKYGIYLLKDFNFVGNFSTTFNYHPGHVARYGSDSYVSVGSSHKNVVPTAGIGTFWEVLASGDSSAALNTKGDILTVTTLVIQESVLVLLVMLLQFSQTDYLATRL